MTTSQEFTAGCPGCGNPVTWISRATDQYGTSSDTTPGACATCERNGK